MCQGCDSSGAAVEDAALLTLAVFADELVQAGWEKCWSKRENRPYYFNRFTNQSLWEMPVLGQHDVIVSAHSSRGAVLMVGCSAGAGAMVLWISDCTHGRVTLPPELLVKSIVWLDSNEMFFLLVHAWVVLFQCSALLKEHLPWGSSDVFFSTKS